MKLLHNQIIHIGNYAKVKDLLTQNLDPQKSSSVEL